MTTAHLDPHAVILTPRQLAIRAAREAHSQWGISWPEIISPSRRRGPLHKARVHVASHLRDQGFTTTQIGRIMGGRDHTTICYYLGTLGRNRK